MARRRYDARYDIPTGYAVGEGLVDLGQLLRQSLNDFQRQTTVDEESSRRDADYLLRLQQFMAQDEDRKFNRGSKEFDQQLALANFMRMNQPKAPEPFTLGEGQTRFGADGKPLANVPKADPLPKAPEPFTLSPGQRRFDPTGQVTAENPAEVKPTKPFYEGKSPTELELILSDPTAPADQKAQAKDALARIDAKEDRRRNAAAVIQFTNQEKISDMRDQRERGQKADSLQSELGQVQTVVDKMDALVPKVNYSGPLGGLGGALNKAAEWTQTSPTVNQLANLGEAYLSIISKGAMRQSGVLSDQDLERARRAVPLVTDRLEVAQNKLADLKDILRTATQGIERLRGGQGQGAPSAGRKPDFIYNPATGRLEPAR